MAGSAACIKCCSVQGYQGAEQGTVLGKSERASGSCRPCCARAAVPPSKHPVQDRGKIERSGEIDYLGAAACCCCSWLCEQATACLVAALRSCLATLGAVKADGSWPKVFMAAALPLASQAFSATVQQGGV